jgi:predicted nucleotidyltransferase
LILEQDFEDFVKLLNKHGVEYMVVGGYALAFHGKPRSTGDLDIWINISQQNAQKMLAVVKGFGLTSMGFNQEDFLKPGYITQIGYPPLRIDILNSIDGVEFNKAVENMQQIVLDNNLKINYVGVGDFIKNKQACGRKQDLIDIKEIKKNLLLERRERKNKGKHL